MEFPDYNKQRDSDSAVLDSLFIVVSDPNNWLHCSVNTRVRIGFRSSPYAWWLRKEHQWSQNQVFFFPSTSYHNFFLRLFLLQWISRIRAVSIGQNIQVRFVDLN